jgi:Kef-type K+ transport system membrane component KefB
MELLPILLMLVVLYAVARIGNRIAEHFGVPGLIGEIIMGIIVANLVIGDWSLLESIDVVMPEPGTESDNVNYSVLYALAELGVIFLLFSVGLETKVNDLLKVGKSAMYVAILGVILPFILGFAYIEMDDGNFHHAMFLAAAMVATSVGITARVIKEMGMMSKMESRIIIGAAVIDDVLGMIVLAIVKGVAGTEGGIDIANVIEVIVVACVFVLAAIGFAKWVMPKIVSKASAFASKRGKTYGIDVLALSILVCLFMAWLAESIGLAAIIGSFLAGMIFADYAEKWDLSHKVDVLTTFMISFFFLHVGMQVDISQLNTKVLIEALVVIILAIIGKYVGCGGGAWLADHKTSRSSISIIGVGMIPRGEVGIIVASIGLNTIVEGAPALSDSLYTVIVLMAVVTTIIAPPILSRLYAKKYPPEPACEGDTCHIPEKPQQ